MLTTKRTHGPRPWQCSAFEQVLLWKFVKGSLVFLSLFSFLAFFFFKANSIISTDSFTQMPICHLKALSRESSGSAFSRGTLSIARHALRVAQCGAGCGPGPATGERAGPAPRSQLTGPHSACHKTRQAGMEQARGSQNRSEERRVGKDITGHERNFPSLGKALAVAGDTARGPCRPSPLQPPSSVPGARGSLGSAWRWRQRMKLKSKG